MLIHPVDQIFQWLSENHKPAGGARSKWKALGPNQLNMTNHKDNRIGFVIFNSAHHIKNRMTL